MNLRKKKPTQPCGPDTTGPCRPKPRPKGANLALADALFSILGFQRVKPATTKPKQ